MLKTLKTSLKDESAATAIEYAIIQDGIATTRPHVWRRAGSRACPTSNHLGMRGIPVFLQKWWLDTVGNAVSVHEVQSFEGGEVIGSLSYIEHFNKAGILFGGNLPWTALGGPILAQDLSGDRKRQVLDQLLAQLPKRTSFIFVCSPHATDADLIELSFKIAGFALSKRETYSRSPEDVEVLGLLKRKSRAHIKAADKKLTVVDISAEEFADFYAENLRDAGVASYSPLHVARDLIAEGISRKQVRAIAAKKRIVGSLDSRPFDAAIACAWDEYRYYYWLSTRRHHSDGNAEDKANPDAIKVLILRAMSHAQEKGLIFEADCVKLGDNHLFGTILKLQKEELRNVFTRYTWLARSFLRYGPMATNVLQLVRPSEKSIAGELREEHSRRVLGE